MLHVMHYVSEMKRRIQDTLAFYKLVI